MYGVFAAAGGLDAVAVSGLVVDADTLVAAAWGNKSVTRQRSLNIRDCSSSPQNNGCCTDRHNYQGHCRDSLQQYDWR